VALGDGAQLREPVDGPAKVGDEDDLATRRCAPGDEAQCRLGRARAVGGRLVVGAAGAVGLGTVKTIVSPWTATLGPASCEPSTGLAVPWLPAIGSANRAVTRMSVRSTFGSAKSVTRGRSTSV